MAKIITEIEDLEIDKSVPPVAAPGDDETLDTGEASRIRLNTILKTLRDNQASLDSGVESILDTLDTHDQNIEDLEGLIGKLKVKDIWSLTPSITPLNFDQTDAVGFTIDPISGGTQNFTIADPRDELDLGVGTAYGSWAKASDPIFIRDSGISSFTSKFDLLNPNNLQQGDVAFLGILPEGVTVKEIILDLISGGDISNFPGSKVILIQVGSSGSLQVVDSANMMGGVTLSLLDGDTISFRYNWGTKEVSVSVLQQDSYTAFSQFDINEGDSLNFGILAMPTTPTTNAGATFLLGTDGENPGFYSGVPAELPEEAEEGDLYEISGSGSYAGESADEGDLALILEGESVFFFKKKAEVDISALATKIELNSVSSEVDDIKKKADFVHALTAQTIYAYSDDTYTYSGTGVKTALYELDHDGTVYLCLGVSNQQNLPEGLPVDSFENKYLLFWWDEQDELHYIPMPPDTEFLYNHAVYIKRRIDIWGSTTPDLIPALWDNSDWGQTLIQAASDYSNHLVSVRLHNSFNTYVDPTESEPYLKFTSVNYTNENKYITYSGTGTIDWSNNLQPQPGLWVRIKATLGCTLIYQKGADKTAEGLVGVRLPANAEVVIYRDKSGVAHSSLRSGTPEFEKYTQGFDCLYKTHSDSVFMLPPQSGLVDLSSLSNFSIRATTQLPSNFQIIKSNTLITDIYKGNGSTILTNANSNLVLLVAGTNGTYSVFPFPPGVDGTHNGTSYVFKDGRWVEASIEIKEKSILSEMISNGVYTVLPEDSGKLLTWAEVTDVKFDFSGVLSETDFYCQVAVISGSKVTMTAADKGIYSNGFDTLEGAGSMSMVKKLLNGYMLFSGNMTAFYGV